MRLSSWQPPFPHLSSFSTIWGLVRISGKSRDRRTASMLWFFQVQLLCVFMTLSHGWVSLPPFGDSHKLIRIHPNLLTFEITPSIAFYLTSQYMNRHFSIAVVSNYSSKAKAILPHVFVNKVLLKDGHTYDCSHVTEADSWQKWHSIWSTGLGTFSFYLALCRKSFVRSCPRGCGVKIW